MTDYRTQPINQKNADFVEQVADRIEEMQLEGRSLWQDAKRRFFRNNAAVASLIILAFIIIFITVAPWFFPFTYEDTDWNMMSAAPTMDLSLLRYRCLGSRLVGTYCYRWTYFLIGRYCWCFHFRNYRHNLWGDFRLCRR